jgi:2-oxo-4-hydroxy-4-carboxy-5-ureidoimidazoline decarboxylase
MTAAAVDGINAMSEEELRLELRHCCASDRWVALVMGARPYASADALLQHAADALEELTDEDWLEAFAVAGIREPHSGDEATRSATRVALRLYEERFGYPFVAAEQPGGEELLMRVRIRLGLEPDAQQRASRAHQRRLTHARLQRLIERSASADHRAQSPGS